MGAAYRQSSMLYFFPDLRPTPATTMQVGAYHLELLKTTDHATQNN
jgi:hypothetical protein